MSKRKVAIVIDSTANLPDKLVAQHQIYVVPQIVNWDGQSLLDGIDIKTEAFYAKLSMSQTSPTTSQPSPGEFLEHFQRVAETADSIVGIFISEHLSGTLSSARQGAAMMGDYPIEIVDSRSASMGLGLVALAAAQAAADGKDYQEIAAIVRRIVPHLRVLFVVDTLEYLHRGGRIGGAKRLIGSVSSIKPVLHLEGGKIEPLASIRTKKKAVEHMLQVLQQETAGKSQIHAAVMHAAAEDEARRIADTIQSAVQPLDIVQGALSPVIGTHVGPGTLGVAYYAES